MPLQDFRASPSDSKELCFDGNVFLKDTFSIGHFLREHRNVSLEVIRDDLGTFLKTLRLSLIELINEDYEDFVNLSKDLIGLNHGIQNIQTPLQQVWDEATQVKCDLENTITELEDCLNQEQQIRETKKSLQHLTQAITSVNKLESILPVGENENQKSVTLDMMERATTEFNQLQFSMSKSRENLPDEMKSRAKQAETILLALLKNIFLACVCERHSVELCRCLQIFASLNKQSEVDALVRAHIIAPTLANTIRTSSFSKLNNLREVYQEVLNIMDFQLKELLELTVSRERAPSVVGYDFITNSLWPELKTIIEEHLNHEFTPKASDLNHFHIIYTDTMFLLSELENRCGNQRNVAQFREGPNYQLFMAKWNLPVYYKMRFQEIAKHVEGALGQEHPLHSSNSDLSLKASTAVLTCLNLCWSKNVYISEIGHLFWKLSLQVISRYSTWIIDILATKTEAQKKTLIPENSRLEGNVGNSHQQQQQTQSRLDLLVCLFSDSTKVSQLASKSLEEHMKKLPCYDSTKETLSLCLQETLTQLQQQQEPITNSIVKQIVVESVQYLSYISEIPSKYMHIYRDMPTKPCDYVDHTLAVLKAFHATKQDQIAEELLQHWLTLTVTELSRKFHTLVAEQLRKVETQESSLRKIKKGKQASTEHNQKIRKQLMIDVHYFKDSAAAIGIDVASIHVLQELAALVTSAADRGDKQ